jgi:fatty acid desaturase
VRTPYPVPSALNLAVIALQVPAVLACLALAARVQGWGLLLLALAFGVLMNSVYSIIHEAEHGILLRGRRANDAVGTLMALLFPAPFHLLRQGHLGHHLRNRSDDEAFDLWFEGESPAWKRLQLYGILTGFYWLVVASGNLVVLLAPSLLQRGRFGFDRPTAALVDSLNPRYWRLIQAEAAAALLLHAGLIVALGVPWLRYLAVYAGFGFTWSALQYAHHFGTERHVTRGARNLWIGQPLDALWLNHNWHRVHHENPTVPWPYLPRLGRREDPRREFLAWAYLRMWRGPRRARERVENRFAGRIIA